MSNKFENLGAHIISSITNHWNRIGVEIDIRHTLNDNYFSRLGHIAYYIKLEERNKGYATETLKLALEKLKNEYKVNKVLITCLKDNIASRKVIEANGGIFEKEFYDEITNNYIQRFWITF